MGFYCEQKMRSLLFDFVCLSAFVYCIHIKKEEIRLKSAKNRIKHSVILVKLLRKQIVF